MGPAAGERQRRGVWEGGEGRRRRGGRIRWSGDGAVALDDIGPRCMEVVGVGACSCVLCRLRAGGVGALKLLPMLTGKEDVL